MRWVLWLVVFSWFSAVLLLLVWQKQSASIVFDPQLVMVDQLQSLDAALTGYTNEDTVTAIHITSEDCFCNLSSRKHRNEVWRLSQSQGIDNVALTLESLPAVASALIPAAPAVLVYHGKNLTYAGPYSAGTFCSTGNGLVEPWLTSIEHLRAKYPDTLSPVLPSDAQGCYCRNTLQFS